ncbi:MAG TPA: hypothetical protein DDW98_09070 [Gammaproteobacteria bacterium]|jgi:hypothetical protein|nr:hypothetical protein [Gammaproteobacteria bacterium]
MTTMFPLFNSENIEMTDDMRSFEDTAEFEEWFYSLPEHAHWSALTPAYRLAHMAWTASRALIKRAEGQKHSEVAPTPGLPFRDVRAMLPHANPPADEPKGDGR